MPTTLYRSSPIRAAENEYVIARDAPNDAISPPLEQMHYACNHTKPNDDRTSYYYYYYEYYYYYYYHCYYYYHYYSTTTTTSYRSDNPIQSMAA